MQISHRMWREGIIRDHFGSRRTKPANEGSPNAGPAVVGRNGTAMVVAQAATTNDADNSEELRFHQAFAKRCSRHPRSRSGPGTLPFRMRLPGAHVRPFN